MLKGSPHLPHGLRSTQESTRQLAGPKLRMGRFFATVFCWQNEVKNRIQPCFQSYLIFERKHPPIDGWGTRGRVHGIRTMTSMDYEESIV